MCGIVGYIGGQQAAPLLLEGLARLGLGDDWLRAVCWENGVRLLGSAP